MERMRGCLTGLIAPLVPFGPSIWLAIKDSPEVSVSEGQISQETANEVADMGCRTGCGEAVRLLMIPFVGYFLGNGNYPAAAIFLGAYWALGRWHLQSAASAIVKMEQERDRLAMGQSLHPRKNRRGP